MKVLHVIVSMANGGRERRMSSLVNSLTNSPCKQSVILTDGGSQSYYEIDKTVQVYNLISFQSKYSRLKEFFRIVKLEKPDIVHCWTDVRFTMGMLLLGKLIFKYKLVMGFVADGNIPNGKLTKLCNKLSFNYSNVIISNSKAGLRAKNAPLIKSEVIYNGFDFNRLKKKPLNEELLRSELECQDKTIISMCARFSNAKNWDMFLDLAEYFQKNNYNDLVFLALGTGDRLNHYQTMAKEKNLKNIRFAGQRNDVENILQISYISVLFSNAEVHAEGVSNSIMEAMAAGCPVVATVGGGTTEIISNNENGFVVNPNDIKACISNITKLIASPDLRRKLGEAARKTVLEKFNLKDMEQKYVDIYNKISNDSKRE